MMAAYGDVQGSVAMLTFDSCQHFGWDFSENW